ncbi:MAG: lysozyme inhibitor LprI family protein [Sphingopyxis sp.]|nr:lysozyme inhibitor LprI family protein [Sphingopyxis sp.]
MWKYAPLVAAAMLAAPASAQTQAQMTRTAEQDYRTADAGMTREWNATNAFMKRRDSANRSRGGGFGYAASLLESQRAWLKFRDNQCVIEGGQFAGGSMQAMARFRCLANLSRERGRQLAGLRWKA